VDISVQKRQELDSAINDAIELLKPAARMKGVGIAVTRNGVGSYALRLSISVPCNTTMEFWDRT
jgi:hypothetical protein